MYKVTWCSMMFSDLKFHLKCLDAVTLTVDELPFPLQLWIVISTRKARSESHFSKTFEHFPSTQSTSLLVVQHIPMLFIHFFQHWSELPMIKCFWLNQIYPFNHVLHHLSKTNGFCMWRFLYFSVVFYNFPFLCLNHVVNLCLHPAITCFPSVVIHVVPLSPKVACTDSTL